MISYRPITPEDGEFLYRVYASTRTEELAQTDWDEAQKETFLRMQFRAQHTHYQSHYPKAQYQVILWNGEPAGRLYLEQWQSEIHLIDIALVPAYRGQGLGTAILKRIFAQAAEAGLPVRIYVEKFNPALRLYKRLGFRAIEDKGVYWFMEWRAEGGAQGE